MMSGIQHFMFCPRQWALIHIEQQWADNRLTAEGNLLHQHVDNPFYRQKNRDVITLRSVQLASQRLGLYGVSDAIELLPASTADNAIKHPIYPGYWYPQPIEFKRGREKSDERDEVQLCAQAIALEELYGITISSGAIFYGETRHRTQVQISLQLRTLTQQLAADMHQIFATGKIPPPYYKTHCRRCSLVNVCLPKITVSKSPVKYLNENLYEDAAEHPVCDNT